MLSFFAAVILAPKMPSELYDYLRKPDASAAWRVVREDKGQTEIELTSQTWQGTAWKHGLLIQQPPKREFKGTAVLYITGDGPMAGDRVQIRLLSGATGMPVAMLFGIPNQPLWNMREDDLIAHTFEEYLATKDPTWPLLFPMTKSALRAMDAIVDVTKKSTNPIKRFIVTGASKRGWTTWLVGASGDKRIVGIAPMVYDNLKVAAQMKHQIDSWGEYSVMIQDYTRRGLQQKLQTPEGQKLASIVDPFTYRSRIKVPTLIVNGGNDPYWTVDALSQYWRELRQPKWARIIPNVSHDLGGGVIAIETIGMFARSLAGAFKMPSIDGRWTNHPSIQGLRPEYYKLNKLPDGLRTAKLWIVTSKTLDFREGKWKPQTTLSLGPTASVDDWNKGLRLFLPDDANSAVFAELRFRFGGREFGLTTPAVVFKANR